MENISHTKTDKEINIRKNKNENKESNKNDISKSKKIMKKPNNAFTVPTILGIDFFKWWCIFLRPFIKLTGREIEVIASFLNQRWLLSKNISDPIILDTMMMSETTKNKVIEECNITHQHFYVVMSNLRKHKVIVNGIINPRLIPNIREDDNGCFQLLIRFIDSKERR